MKKALLAAAIASAISLGAVGTKASATPISDQASTVIAQGNCDWIRPYLSWVGLPQRFVYIAARESGCARNGICHSDRDDLSCSRFGLNFKGSGMQRYWRNTCSVGHYTQTRDIWIDLLCTKAAYNQQGLRPWS